MKLLTTSKSSSGECCISRRSSWMVVSPTPKKALLPSHVAPTLLRMSPSPHNAPLSEPNIEGESIDPPTCGPFHVLPPRRPAVHACGGRREEDRVMAGLRALAAAAAAAEAAAAPPVPRPETPNMATARLTSGMMASRAPTPRAARVSRGFDSCPQLGSFQESRCCFPLPLRVSRSTGTEAKNLFLNGGKSAEGGAEWRSRSAFFCWWPSPAS